MDNIFLNISKKILFPIYSSFQVQAYFGIVLYLFLVIALCGILAAAAYLFSLSAVQDNEKRSEYEGGFEPFDSATRLPFDVHFYLVGILFLIFDVEIALLFPWVLSLRTIGWFGFYLMFGFIFLLAVGFLYEWKRGALIWPSRQRELTYYTTNAKYNLICIFLAVTKCTKHGKEVPYIESDAFRTDIMLAAGIVVLVLLFGIGITNPLFLCLVFKTPKLSKTRTQLIQRKLTHHNTLRKLSTADTSSNDKALTVISDDIPTTNFWDRCFAPKTAIPVALATLTSTVALVFVFFYFSHLGFYIKLKETLGISLAPEHSAPIVYVGIGTAWILTLFGCSRYVYKLPFAWKFLARGVSCIIAAFCSIPGVGFLITIFNFTGLQNGVITDTVMDKGLFTVNKKFTPGEAFEIIRTYILQQFNDGHLTLEQANLLASKTQELINTLTQKGAAAVYKKIAEILSTPKPVRQVNTEVHTSFYDICWQYSSAAGQYVYNNPGTVILGSIAIIGTGYCIVNYVGPYIVAFFNISSGSGAAAGAGGAAAGAGGVATLKAAEVSITSLAQAQAIALDARFKTEKPTDVEDICMLLDHPVKAISIGNMAYACRLRLERSRALRDGPASTIEGLRVFDPLRGGPRWRHDEIIGEMRQYLRQVAREHNALQAFVTAYEKISRFFP